LEKIDQIRQGDYLLVRINMLHSQVTTKDSIIGVSERSNHKHQVKGPAQFQVYSDQSDGSQYIKVDAGCVVIDHQQQDASYIPPGVWRVLHQRQYQPQAPPAPVQDWRLKMPCERERRARTRKAWARSRHLPENLRMPAAH
jgi:hypothetical protein